MDSHLLLLTSEISPLVNRIITPTLKNNTHGDYNGPVAHQTPWNCMRAYLFLRSLAQSDFQQFVKEVIMMPLYNPTDFWPQPAFNTGMSKSLSRALKEGLNANYAFIHAAFFFNTREQNLPRMNHLREFLKRQVLDELLRKKEKQEMKKSPKVPVLPINPHCGPAYRAFL